MGIKLSHEFVGSRKIFLDLSYFLNFPIKVHVMVRRARFSGKSLENRISDGNLMETFIQRSSDLLSIVNKLKKNSTNINYDDDFEALAHDFIQTRMKDLLERYVIILEYGDGYYEIISFKSFPRYHIDFT